MKKQKYTQAELEILSLDDSDVIVTSPTRDPNETKPMPLAARPALAAAKTRFTISDKKSGPPAQRVVLID